MKVYLAGPMSGIPAFNVPAFDALAKVLRTWGYEVVSPAELDGPETRAAIVASVWGNHADLPPGETWGFYLSRDIRILADEGIEAVVVLPGWARSKGARLETFAAKAILGLPVYTYDWKTGLVPVPIVLLVREWLGLLWAEYTTMRKAWWPR